MSLTTRGDASPASGLAVIDCGADHRLNDPAAWAQPQGIRFGNTGRNLIRQPDINRASFDALRLNAALPAEATDPAACGVLR